ncbi:sodium:proton antiporter [Thermosphaera chiliense]|uniref:Sodium:proton antiporter n=1 Tax=Thermosphaera chiliense TaxID=3402707 RepID=A0A7M1UNX0_9CREN|nr:sodium:proton antiporter [Thermosphaera aggregans]QOR93911.1 sodium:proton antiporter [Thermosphaera aggregans]
MTHSYSLNDPLVTTILVFTSMSVSFLVLLIIYQSLKSRVVRETKIYLSGEPEEVVREASPSVGNLYWGFIKKFARSIFNTLINKVQTGSIHEWFSFISSWLGILILLAVLMSILYLLAR